MLIAKEWREWSDDISLLKKVLLDSAVELKRLERNPFAPPFRTGNYLPRKVRRMKWDSR